MKTTASKIILALTLSVLFVVNANAGRWLTKDPIGFMERDPKPTSSAVAPSVPEINLYTFVDNNPINEVDPLGLWGIQFGSFNIGIGNPNLAFDSSSWFDLQQGASATTDGLLTAVTANGLFGTFNPNLFRNNYDPCDSTLQWSHGLGEFSGTLLTLYMGGPQGSLFGDTETITHWGSDTLQAGDWVMPDHQV